MAPAGWRSCSSGASAHLLVLGPHVRQTRQTIDYRGAAERQVDLEDQRHEDKLWRAPRSSGSAMPSCERRRYSRRTACTHEVLGDALQ
jgi:hypothetical protein